MTHQIILLGKDITSVYHGIKEFAPDCVHLLMTEQTRHVADTMYPMIPQISRHIYPCEPYNGHQIRKVCRSIHEKFTGEFSYHLSEGTKPMMLAAWQIAVEQGAKPFYLTQLGDLVWLDTFEVEPMQSRLDNDEILTLSGNVLSDYNDIKQLRQDDVRASRRIKEFIEEYPQEHARIGKFFGVFCQRQISRLPASKLLANELRFKHKNGEILITRRGKIVLRLPQRNATTLYFKGSWWETLVADQARIWSERKKNPPEVWQNVLFQTEDKYSRTKNEVDMLVNNKLKLIFIECKSGVITQNDIYKIDGVRETYGGDISKAVLASYYPLDKTLKEKCDDLQINVFAPSHIDERFHFLDTMPDWLDRLTLELQL